jgi:hypothetical protein
MNHAHSNPCVYDVSESIISATIDAIVLHGTMVKTCNHIFDYKMALNYVCKYATTISLNENEDEKCIHIIHD